MISKDQSIVTQVAAKIASELTNTTAIPERTPEAIQALYLSHYDFVCEVLNTTHGFNSKNGEAALQEAFPTATMETTTEANAPAPRLQAVSAPQATVTTVRVAGQQHGDLPNWLIAACQKAGVNKVWDNRDKAVGTKRPWFKQADVVDGQEPVAFWPPRGSN